MKRKYGLVALLLMLALISPLSKATFAADEVIVVARANGLIDEDGTVLYSVVLANGVIAVENVSIQAQIPADATFIEALEKPEAATLIGQAGTVVTWEVSSLQGNSILGPFTFRVSFSEDFTEIPAGVSVTISWTSPQAGIIDTIPTSGILKPLAESGQITVDARGTVNEAGENVALPVGETGIEVFILPDTVPTETVLTLRRVPITPEVVPADVEDTWWCVVFEISAEPAVELAHLIAIILPTRRALTPGLAMSVFVKQADESWLQISTPEEAPVSYGPTNFAKQGINPMNAISPAQLGFGGGVNCMPGPFGYGTICSAGGFNNRGCSGIGFGNSGCGFGVGVDVEARARAEVDSDRLSAIGIESATEFLTTPLDLAQWLTPAEG